MRWSVIDSVGHDSLKSSIRDEHDPGDRPPRSADRRRILIFLPFAPYPLRATGISVRYLPILQYLSTRHSLDIALLLSPDVTLEVLEALRPLCTRLIGIADPREKQRTPWERGAVALKTLMPWTLPNTWTFAGTDEIGRRLASQTAAEPYDVVLSVSGYFAPMLRRIPTRRFVVDFVDSPSLMLTRNLLGTSLPEPLRIYERWKMARWEARFIREADAVVYVSRFDACGIPIERTPGRTRFVVPNGLSVGDYTPRTDATIPSPSVGFLGNMSYLPNVEAVEYLFHQVFLPLRKVIPKLSLGVIGRDPSPSVRALGREAGVIVTGAVSDIWPLVNDVDVFAFPLLRGAGLKNKVLEAMYARRPVVTTSIGLEGIGAFPGRELEVHDRATEFREAVRRLLENEPERQRMGEAAHQFVTRAFSWPELVRNFESILLGDWIESSRPETGEHAARRSHLSRL